MLRCYGFFASWTLFTLWTGYIGANVSNRNEQVHRFDNQSATYNFSKLPAYTYTFEPKYSAGVSGSINVQYGGPFSTFAAISIDLDFSKVNSNKITAFNDNCTEEVSVFQWHIHVKWLNKYDSGSFKQCDMAMTGNHYDPLKACGPNSEFAGTSECALKIRPYACNPNNYRNDPLVCEKGDLSGKFGDLKLDKKKQVIRRFYDINYPLPPENTPMWNMILHGVCGKATPRIACAVGRQTSGRGSTT